MAAAVALPQVLSKVMQDKAGTEQEQLLTVRSPNPGPKEPSSSQPLEAPKQAASDVKQQEQDAGNSQPSCVPDSKAISDLQECEHIAPVPTRTSQLINNSLSVPRSLLQERAPELLAATDEPVIRLLCIHMGSSGQCVSMSQEPVTLQAGPLTVGVQGIDFTRLNGKQILRWVALDARVAPSPHPRLVDGAFVWQQHAAGPTCVLTTDKVLVLEVGPGVQRSSQAEQEKAQPGRNSTCARPRSHVALPEPVVPGVPLFYSARANQSNSCAHCGTQSTTQWHAGWDVSITHTAGPASTRHPHVPCNLCHECFNKWSALPASLAGSVARTGGVIPVSHAHVAPPTTRQSALAAARQPVTGMPPVQKSAIAVPAARQIVTSAPAAQKSAVSAAKQTVTGVPASRSTPSAPPARQARLNWQPPVPPVTRLNWQPTSTSRTAMAAVSDPKLSIPAADVMLLSSVRSIAPLSYPAKKLSKGSNRAAQAGPALGTPEPARSVPMFHSMRYAGTTHCAHCNATSSDLWLKGWPLLDESGVSGFVNLCDGCGLRYGKDPAIGPQRRLSSDPPVRHPNPVGGQAHPRQLPALTAASIALEQHNTAPSAAPPPTSDEALARLARQRRAPSLSDDYTAAEAPRDKSVSVGVIRTKSLPGGGPPMQQAATGSLPTGHPRLPQQAGPGSSWGVPGLSLPHQQASRQARSMPTVAPSYPEPVEILMTGAQLVVPPGLVHRHYPMALNPLVPCYVRMVHISGGQYFPAEAEWVQLVLHPTTGQVRVEGADLQPVHGQALRGWRSLEHTRIPGNGPVQTPNGPHLREKDGRMLPLSTDRVLALEVCSPAQPLQLVTGKGHVAATVVIVAGGTAGGSNCSPTKPIEGAATDLQPPASVTSTLGKRSPSLTAEDPNWWATMPLGRVSAGSGESPHSTDAVKRSTEQHSPPAKRARVQGAHTQDVAKTQSVDRACGQGIAGSVSQSGKPHCEASEARQGNGVPTPAKQLGLKGKGADGPKLEASSVSLSSHEPHNSQLDPLPETVGPVQPTHASLASSAGAALKPQEIAQVDGQVHHGGGCAEPETDCSLEAQGLLLDTLRPLAAALRSHGGPAASLIMARLNSWSKLQVQTFATHSLPWVEKLWADCTSQEDQPTAASLRVAAGELLTFLLGPNHQGLLQGSSPRTCVVLLDAVRDIVIGLYICGGPSPTSVWGAACGMTDLQVAGFMRNGLPWLTTLWPTQCLEQRAECSALLKELMRLS